MKENKNPGRFCGSPGGQQLPALILGSKIQFQLSPHGLGNSRWPHWLAEFGLLQLGNRTKHINFSGRQEIRRVSDGHEQIAIIKHKQSLTQEIRIRAILQVRYPGWKHSVAGRSDAGGHPRTDCGGFQNGLYSDTVHINPLCSYPQGLCSIVHGMKFKLYFEVWRPSPLSFTCLCSGIAWPHFLVRSPNDSPVPTQIQTPRATYMKCFIRLLL